MAVAIKGSIRQYLDGLRASSYGFLYIYQLDQKAKERHRRREQWIQNEMMTRRRRDRFGSRRLMHSSGPTSVQNNNDRSIRSKPEPQLLISVILSSTLSFLIWISIWMFNTYLVPSLRFQTQKILPPTPLVETKYEIIKLWKYTELGLQFIFSSLWVLPLYLISKIVNSFWFVNVSSTVYQLFYGRPRAFSSMGMMIADFIYGLLVETVFLVQAMAFKHIPVMQELCFTMFAIHHCLLYSLYAYEYKWYHMGLDVRLRIELIETHWPYFCGFGTPLFVLTNITFSFHPTIISACIFSILFPFFIISATKAGTPQETPAVRLRVFEFSMSICNTLFKSSVKPQNQDAPADHGRLYIGPVRRR